MLRILFARMNGSRVKPKAPKNLAPAPSINKAASIGSLQTPADRYVHDKFVSLGKDCHYSTQSTYKHSTEIDLLI